LEIPARILAAGHRKCRKEKWRGGAQAIGERENMSKIHCIMLTKNEADVVAYCLREATKWADFVYVYDNASTDGTWEIVKSLADDKIIPWKQHSQNFHEGLRADVFNEFRHRSNNGDWWFKLDADNFYRPQLKQELTQIPAGQNLVWAITMDFHITHEDLKVIDFELPVEQVIKGLQYYQAAYSEPQAFRYRERLHWTTDRPWPIHAGVVASFRPLIRHYPHRSPKQIQARLDIRRLARQKGFNGWEHASQAHWMEKIANRKDCQFDDGSGQYIIDEAKIPRHIDPPLRRGIKLLMHRAGIWP
jgi:glycosyltransferase involved in cell wall biosynthesis